MRKIFLVEEDSFEGSELVAVKRDQNEALAFAERLVCIKNREIERGNEYNKLRGFSTFYKLPLTQKCVREISAFVTLDAEVFNYEWHWGNGYEGVTVKEVTIGAELDLARRERKSKKKITISKPKDQK